MEIQKHYLRPGEWMVTEEPAQISTVLGSCVSVTLYHPESRTGGICHGILPFGESAPSEPGRFMVPAILSMLTTFARKGIASHTLQAKVFGGAALFNGSGQNTSVGEQNVQVALEVLRRHRIPVLARNVGGTTGRKIVFRTSTGEVFLKDVMRRDLPVQTSCAI